MPRKVNCTWAERCNAHAYVRITALDLSQVSHPSQTVCRRHVHMVIDDLIGLTRNIEIEGV